MFILTAVTRNLAIARFLCEYSGPFLGMFSKIRLDILSWSLNFFSLLGALMLAGYYIKLGESALGPPARPGYKT